MKKIIFVLAFVLMCSITFANSESSNSSINEEEVMLKNNNNLSSNNNFEDQICRISHTVYDEEGNWLGTVVYTVDTDYSCKEASKMLEIKTLEQFS